MVSATSYSDSSVDSFLGELPRHATVLTSCLPFLFFFLPPNSWTCWNWNNQYSYPHMIWNLCAKMSFSLIPNFFPFAVIDVTCSVPLPTPSSDPINKVSLPAHTIWPAEFTQIGFLLPYWNFTRWLYLNCSKLLIAPVLNGKIINPDISKTFSI